MSEWGRTSPPARRRSRLPALAAVLLALALAGAIAAFRVIANDEAVVAREAEIARLQGKVAELEGRLARIGEPVAGGDGGEADLAAKEDEIARLRARLDAAEAATGELQRQLDEAFNQRIPALKSDIADRDAMLETLDREIARLSSVEDQLRAAKRNEETLRSELAASKARVAKLGEQTANPEEPAKDEPVVSGDASPPPANGRQPGPRDPLRVARAMRDSAGLGQISEDERDRIATGLIEGECVSKVLSDVFGRAPALALRDLIRALESDC